MNELITEVSDAGSASVVVMLGLRSGEPAAPKLLVMRREALDRLSSGAQPYREVRSTGPQSIDGTAPQPVDLLVVADAERASACETLVMLAKQMRRALVVGEMTAGVMSTGELLPYLLPHRALLVLVPKKVFHPPRPELRNVDGVGLSPDLWLDARDEAALERLLRCTGEPACFAGLRAQSRNGRGSR